jgi:hypothetical protein
MHTYLKQANDKYDIGQWLINREGHHQFTAIFSVPSLKQAFTAVNALNGGTKIDVNVLHMTERE